MNEKGEVTSVEARVSRAADRSFDQLLSGLQRVYGHGELTVCRNDRRWVTPTIEVYLNQGPDPYAASISYLLRSHYTMMVACP
jgi:hypothetical protein